MPTDTWRELLSLADRLEPRLARAYLAAIARLRARTDAAEIARAIADNRQYWIPAANLPLFEQAMDPVLAVVTDAVQQAGQQTAARFTDPLGVSMRFDLTNPLAIEVARQTAAGMVTNISAETRIALQNVIRRAIEEGITYRDAASLIRQMVGLTARDSQAALNYRAALIELGLNRDKVRAKVAQYAMKKLRERATLIARTEIMGSTNLGQLMAWRQAADKGLIPVEARQRWLATPGSDRTCPICLAMHGKEVSIQSSFPGGNPPRHPACRCTAVLVVHKVGVRQAASSAKTHAPAVTRIEAPAPIPATMVAQESSTGGLTKEDVQTGKPLSATFYRGTATGQVEGDKAWFTTDRAEAERYAAAAAKRTNSQPVVTSQQIDLSNPLVTQKFTEILNANESTLKKLEDDLHDALVHWSSGGIAIKSNPNPTPRVWAFMRLLTTHLKRGAA